MNRIDELLHETLGTAPPSPSGAPPWELVTRRGDELVRRRRIRWTTLAIAVLVVLVAAGTALARSGEGHTSRSIVATPPPTGSTIVAAVDGKIVTMSPSDGHIIGTLVDDATTDSRSGLVSGVAISPDAKTLYYTRTSTQDRCGRTVIVEYAIATGAERELVAGFYPVVSPDGHWLAYTTVECGDSHNFLAITALAPRAHYRPYEQLLGEEPSKVQPLAWSSTDQLLWNRYHQGPPDQQTFNLISPPLDHGNAPTPLDTQHSVAAAAYFPNGDLVVAQGTPDHWEVDVLKPDGSTRATRIQSTGPMPMTMAVAPTGEALLLTMPDGRVLIQEGSNPPHTIATGVQAAAWMPSPPSSAQSIAPRDWSNTSATTR